MWLIIFMLFINDNDNNDYCWLAIVMTTVLIINALVHNMIGHSIVNH